MILSPKINSFFVESEHELSSQMHTVSPVEFNSPIVGNLQQMINKLNKKLQKKDQLIRYLERKCGDQVIKSSRKLYVQIDKLQAQNRQLKQYMDMQQQKKSGSRLGDACIGQFITFTPQKGNEKANDVFYQQLLKLSVQQLRALATMQASQIQKLYLQRQYKCKQNRKSFHKQKKHMLSSTKRQALTQRDHPLSGSIQNQNYTNIALRDSTSSLNISLAANGLKFSQQINKNQITALTLKKTIQTQTTPLQCQQSQTQTTQNLEDIERYEQTLNDLKIENDIIRKQLERLIEQNKGLREEALYFAQRIQDYCKEIQTNQMNFQKKMLQSFTQQDLNNQPEIQKNVRIIENYKEVLQIFGIEWIKYPHLSTNTITDQNLSYSASIQQDKIHQRLLHEICDTKLQITHLLKQYRKLQKQLFEATELSKNMENYIANEQDQIRGVQEFNLRLSDMIAQLIQQLMSIKSKQLSVRYQSRHLTIKKGSIQLSDAISGQLIQNKQTASEEDNTSKDVLNRTYMNSELDIEENKLVL